MTTPVVPRIDIADTILALAETEQQWAHDFTQLRIYGTPHEPLFIARDVQEMLEIPDLQTRASGFDPGVHHRIIRIETPAGPRDVMAITDQGLFLALNHSRKPIARMFQEFVFSVIKRLVITGSVTMSQAVEDAKRLAIANIELKEKYLREYAESEDQHRRLLESQARVGALESETFAVHRRLALAEREIKNYRGADHRASSDARDHYLKAVRMFAQPVHIMLMTPPEEYCDTYDYKISGPLPPANNYEYIYGIQLTRAEPSQRHMTTVYIHPGQSIDVLHREFQSMQLALPKKGGAGGYHPNMYASPLDELARVAMALFDRSHSSVDDMCEHDLRDLLD